MRHGHSVGPGFSSPLLHPVCARRSRAGACLVSPVYERALAKQASELLGRTPWLRRQRRVSVRPPCPSSCWPLLERANLAGASGARRRGGKIFRLSGSVLSLLKTKGWAVGLAAGSSNSNYEANSCFCLFEVCLARSTGGVGLQECCPVSPVPRARFKLFSRMRG